MFENNQIDFSDMINFVLNAFESDKEFLKETKSNPNNSINSKRVKEKFG
jgi:hypothetical protein